MIIYPQTLFYPPHHGYSFEDETLTAFEAWVLEVWVGGSRMLKKTVFEARVKGGSMLRLQKILKKAAGDGGSTMQAFESVLSKILKV